VTLTAASHPDVRTGAASGLGPEGYRLTAGDARVVIESGGPAGAFYARATLAQLCRLHESAGAIPGLFIEDRPDLAYRGVMLDVSRDRVPTIATLHRLVDELSSWKVNVLQLYTEHTFAYPGHADVWKDASPLTAVEIQDLDAYCRERFVELVPNQNSFGHMERWLRVPAYAPLAEMAAPDGETMSLCPVDPRAVDFLAGLYDALLPSFSSRRLNVGCDETVDLGKGRSRDAVEARGKGVVYLEFLEKIHALVAARGRTMQFWGDIILEHPELISRLPKDAVALNWGYEADHPFDPEGARFSAAGIEHHVCPGTSSWLSLTGRTTNAVANIAAAASAAAAHRATGMLVTDWGDYGHHQPLPISYPGLAYGAACMWGRAANESLDLGAALDTHVFRDPTGILGHALCALGDVHRETGATPKNATVAALLLLFPERTIGEGRLAGVTAEGLAQAAARAEEIVAPIPDSRPRRDDADLLRAEIQLASGLFRHACRLGIARLATAAGTVAGISSSERRALASDLDRLIVEFRRLWRTRSREGGLEDSAGRLERLLAMYRA